MDANEIPPPTPEPAPGHGTPLEPAYPYAPPPGYPPEGYRAGNPRQPPARRGPRLGLRGFGRPVPRFGVTLAGAGVALAVIGAFVWSSDIVGGGTGGDGSPDAGRRLLGVTLMAALVVAGYLVALVGRRGPLVTAGVAATAFGVPVLLVFATLHKANGFELPVNLDVVVLVSVGAWLGAYLFAPVVAGHAIYLGLATTTFWFYLLDKSEPALLSFPFASVLSTINGVPAPTVDLSTVSTLSLVTGIAYYAVAFLLDRIGRGGPATPFVFAGVVATTVGLLATSHALHATGTGVLTIAVGVVLLAYGVVAGRRFTAWYWAAGVAVGVLAIVGDNIKHNATAAGVTLIVVGAAVVAGAHFAAQARHEPDEVELPHPQQVAG